MASETKASSYIMKVEIQSKKWIKPSAPTPPHLHKLNLSSIDQHAPPIFVRPIFYFDIASEIEAQTTPERLIVRLEESLSKILTLYYPFAGRYNNEDESSLSCQDQGVEFVVASVDCKLNELVDGEYDKKVLLSGLERIQSTSSDVAWTPVVMVQVNVFNCGGLAIGLGFFHKVGDMFTISTFMNAWATVSRFGTLDQVVRMSFNTSSLLPPRDLPKPSKSEKPPPPPKYIIKRCIFSGEAIAKLKSAIIESELNTAHNYYTRVELVTALITRNLINIERSKGAQPKRLVIAQPMNFRSRTTLPIEENSCGNLCIPVMATQDHVENESLELQELARLIKDSMKNVASEVRKVRDWSELRQKVEKSVVKFHEEASKGQKVIMVLFTSWLRFGLYGVDFGWGRPSLVSTTPLPNVFVWLMDCESDGCGIEAWVNLEEHDMARFQHQPDILAYTSSQ